MAENADAEHWRVRRRVRSRELALPRPRTTDGGSNCLVLPSGGNNPAATSGLVRRGSRAAKALRSGGEKDSFTPYASTHPLVAV
jgi:hypothetical protein